MQVVARGTVFDASAASPEDRFCTFTTLARLSDGRLAVAFRTGSSKDSADEDVHMMLGQDDGMSWQTAFEGFGDVPPGSGGRIRSAGLTEIGPGKLMGAFTTFDRSDPSLPLANPETQGTLPSRTFVGGSEDGGRSWSPLREVSLAPHLGTLTGNILVLKDGTLALPYEAWKGYYDTSPGEHHASLRLSSDGGKTWRGPVIVAHDPRNRLLYWDQRLCVHPRSGRFVAMFWTHDRQAQQDVPIHIAWGSPDGMEWSEPVSTGVKGQICAPLYLADGRLFAAYVHRHRPPGLRAMLSHDDGHTWMAAGELVFYEKARDKGESGMDGRRDFGDYWADMSIWTFGHPAATQLPNGDVLVAYYAGDEKAMSIHWVRITLDPLQGTAPPT
jgi:hypothetical protein